ERLEARQRASFHPRHVDGRLGHRGQRDHSRHRDRRRDADELSARHPCQLLTPRRRPSHASQGDRDMIETRQLELDDARAAAAAATREAEANGWKVGISIVDAGGHLILYERMDGAPPSTARVSFEKAHTAAIFRTATAGME